MEKLAVFLILAGLLLIAGFGLYQVVSVLLFVAEIPLVIKVGILMILLGLVVVLVKLIWERTQGGNDDVDRKY